MSAKPAEMHEIDRALAQRNQAWAETDIERALTDGAYELLSRSGRRDHQTWCARYREARQLNQGDTP